MKVLFFSDLHAHAFKAYSTVLPQPVGRNSRLQDAILILQEIKSIADQEGVDGILFGGDLFHIRPGAGTMKIPTFNAIYDAIARLKIGCSFVGLLVGNHDQGDRAGLEHSIYAFGSIVTVMDRAGWFKFEANDKEQYVFALPAQGRHSQVKEIIDQTITESPELAEKAILLGHLPIAGGVVGCNFHMSDENASKLDDLRPDYFHRIFLGDFHKPQTLQPGVQYIGATHHHNWGDAGQRRGCLIWDTVTDEVTFHHLTSAPRFEKVSADSWVKDMLVSPPPGAFIRVIHSTSLSGATRDEITGTYLQAGARSVEFWLEQKVKDTSVISKTSEFHPSMDQEEMIVTFVKREIPDNLEEDMLISTGRDIMNKAMEQCE